MLGKVAIFCKNMLDWAKSERSFIYPFIKAFPLSNDLLLITLLLCLATFNILYFSLSIRFGVNLFIQLFVIALLSSAFIAGFCHIVKKAVQKKFSDKEFERFGLGETFELFYAGVGKRYLQFLGGFILFFLIITFGMVISLILATKFICPLNSIGLDVDTLQLVLANPDAMNEFVAGMTKSQILHLIELFYITNIFTPAVIGFLLLLWIPELMYSGKNVLVSLFSSIKKLFSDFWNILCIYTIISLGHFIIAITFTQMPEVGIIQYLGSLLFIYWVVYNSFTIFIYYQLRFVENRQDV